MNANFVTPMSTNTLTVIFKGYADSAAAGMCEVDFRQGGYRQRVQFGTSNGLCNYLCMDNNGNLKKYDYNWTTEHTMVITFQVVSGTGIVTNLYVDGTLYATATATATHADSSLLISDGSGSSVYTGHLDYFYYTTDGVYAPGTVSLPTGI